MVTVINLSTITESFFIDEQINKNVFLHQFVII